MSRCSWSNDKSLQFFREVGGEKFPWKLEDLCEISKKNVDLLKMLGKSKTYYPKWWFNGDESHGRN